ncbi:MAG: C4-dicarboxylate ABC transporter [Prevotella sp.]|nr:C4-dicarboxylate ABC transporter [Prevotella sp.]
MKRNQSIEDILLPLKDAPNQAYLSNAIQVADILEWILGQVGVATIWQTSFSISEEFLRRLYFIKKSKKVKEINLILDHKATNKTLKLWVFITQVIRKTYLADNHSKILLVESEDGQQVAVITSQNLTRGNRHESAFISTDKAIFQRLKVEVESLIKNKSVPLHELFEQKTKC